MYITTVPGGWMHRNLGLHEPGEWPSQPGVGGGGGAGAGIAGRSALCAGHGGLSPGQRRFCHLYADHMPSVARAVRIAAGECQRQFRYRRWNCSTAAHRAGSTNVTSSLFGHVTDIGLFTVRYGNLTHSTLHCKRIRL